MGDLFSSNYYPLIFKISFPKSVVVYFLNMGDFEIHYYYPLVSKISFPKSVVNIFWKR